MKLIATVVDTVNVAGVIITDTILIIMGAIALQDIITIAIIITLAIPTLIHITISMTMTILVHIGQVDLASISFQIDFRICFISCRPKGDHAYPVLFFC